ncbi:MAG TPA: hypothetical protein VHJ20_22280 [Polyangia bacterium]|nr:hypothetical protein [Polyangia bacterium]
MGLVVVAVLTVLTATASLAVVARLGVAGRAERLVAATLVWNGLVALPIYVLGFAGALTAAPLGVAALVASIAAIALAGRGRLADTRVLAREIIRAPLDAVRLLTREKSPAFPGVVFACGLVVYLVVAAFLLPAYVSWDVLWYHEPIVGFTIQNHGFAIVDLPPTLQKIVAYPRLAEMTQLWFVIFGGRRLLDVTNLVFAPALAAAVFALCRRVGAQRATALAWGAAIVVMPACANLLQSNFVDPQAAALLVAAFLFATRAPLTTPDATLAALGLALAVGAKPQSLAPVALLGVVTAVRVARAPGVAKRAVVVGAGGALILLVAGSTYVRNWIAFHNPFWPDLKVDVPALGIHWPGLVSWFPQAGNANGWSLNLNEPPWELFGDMLSLPWTIKKRYIGESTDYGIGVAWIVVPLGVVAWACGALRLARATLARVRRQPLELSPADVTVFSAVAVVALVLAVSPAWWAARYHISTIALVVVLVARLLARPGWERVAEASPAAVLIMAVMMFWWTPEPHWWPTPARLAAAAATPFPAREHARTLGAAVDPTVAAAREQELTSGKLLVFDESYAGFPAVFWNDDYSNRVAYLPSGPDLLARAAGANATWIFLTDTDASLAKARAPGSGWREVGVLNAVNGGHAFRREGVAP